MIKSYEYKLYLNKKQIKTLENYLQVCCGLFNLALEQKTRSWNEKKVSISLYDQQKILTKLRNINPKYRNVPLGFERDALRRVDRAFKSFFRRCRLGQKPGYPRFKKASTYKSIEFLEQHHYVKNNKIIYISGIGLVRARGQKFLLKGVQKALTILKKASGWFAQIMVDDLSAKPEKNKIQNSIGLDLGINNFIATSKGELFKGPKFLKKLDKKINRLQKKLNKKLKNSNRRVKITKKLGKVHEIIKLQRRNFCHKLSSSLVKDNDLIILEKLNIHSMIKDGYFNKSINDCGWSIFKEQVKYKAEWAGASLVFVNSKYTSQECPNCSVIAKKSLDERIHSCRNCGCTLDRDHAAAIVILKRGLKVLGLAETQCSWKEAATRAPNEVSNSENRILTENRLQCSYLNGFPFQNLGN